MYLVKLDIPLLCDVKCFLKTQNLYEAYAKEYVRTGVIKTNYKYRKTCRTDMTHAYFLYVRNRGYKTR